MHWGTGVFYVLYLDTICILTVDVELLIPVE